MLGATEPDARLDAMLDSHFPEVDVDGLAPIFECAALRQLLGLIINAILYATSAEAQPERCPQPERCQPPGRAVVGERRAFSSEQVYYLPGKIDIRTLRKLQRLRRQSGHGQLTSRSLVRGHWRRANWRWQDQRPWWIRPYWRGPSGAPIIERDYRLKP
jgi:hypothetical protein